MDLIDILRSVELFLGLNREQLQKVAEISSEKTFQMGDTVIQQGEFGNQLYIVEKGQVKVVVHQKDDPGETKVFLGAGQIFGEIALVDYGPRTADIVASHDGTVLHEIVREDFDNLCKRDSALGYVVMRNLASDIAFKLRHSNLQQQR